MTPCAADLRGAIIGRLIRSGPQTETQLAAHFDCDARLVREQLDYLATLWESIRFTKSSRVEILWIVARGMARRCRASW